jgi:transcription antitermination factor NusG
VAAFLSEKNICNYCPLNKTLKQWSDRKKIVFEPLFKSYVFVRVTDQEKWNVMDIPGVLNYVYWLGKPAQIKDEEIELIRNFLNEHKDVIVEKREIVLNQTIRIVKGSFINHVGRVYEIQGNRVKVVIESLGLALIANFPITAVQSYPVESKNF